MAKRALNFAMVKVELTAYWQATTHQRTGRYAGILPPGQYVGHCGRWQRLEHIPHTCTCCGVRLFTEEEVHHD